MIQIHCTLPWKVLWDSGMDTPCSSPALLNPLQHSTVQEDWLRHKGLWWVLATATPQGDADAPEPPALQTHHLGPVPCGGSWPASARALLLSPPHERPAWTHLCFLSFWHHQTRQEQNKTLRLPQDLVPRDTLREVCPWSRFPSPS